MMVQICSSGLLLIVLAMGALANGPRRAALASGQQQPSKVEPSAGFRGSRSALASGQQQLIKEIRAMWVVRTTLTSPETIRAMVAAARDHGFNTLIVQVRGRGDAYYTSRWEPRAEALKDQPAGFDPLALTITEARNAGLSVHAWLNTFLLANLQELPTHPLHVYNAHPDWLMVPRPVAAALAPMEPANPAYRARIVEWSKGDLTELEGVYASPAHPAVQEHLYNVWMDLVDKYDLDGIHFDYVRFPNANFDYGRVALGRFRSDVEKDLSDGERRAFGQLLANDPLVLTTVYAARWDQFRRDQVTALVERIATGVRQRKPKLLVSAAVFADDQDAYLRRFQDWKLWAERGLIDVLCPMAYTVESDVFKRQIATARGFSFGKQLWAGIGAYRQPVSGTLEKIETARRIGADGIVLFSYDSLSRPSEINPGGDYLARLRDRAFSKKP